MFTQHQIQQETQLLIQQHNQLRLDEIDVHYQEASTVRFVSKACLVDIEPGIMDVIKAPSLGALCAGSNWEKGHYRTLIVTL